MIESFSTFAFCNHHVSLPDMSVLRWAEVFSGSNLFESVNIIIIIKEDKPWVLGGLVY